MTSVVVASTMAVLGITGLVAWHGYGLRRERQSREARIAIATQARLETVKKLYPLREVDVAYAELLDAVAPLIDAPHDQHGLTEARLLSAAMDIAYGSRREAS